MVPTGPVIRRRIAMCMGLFFLLFLGLSTRLFVLTVIDSEALQAKAQSQWTTEAVIQARRGAILDRNGEVLAMSATTNSAYPSRYGLPGQLAPTADWEMLRTAADIADELGVKTAVGSVYSSDYFYYPDPEVSEKERKAGLLAVEMETAGLYTEAMYAGKKALSILQVSDHLFKTDHLTPDEIRTSFHEMMEIALKTAVRIQG